MKSAARRSLLLCAVVEGGTLGFATYAAESGYPIKPIRMIVPFAPGGPGDAVGRLISKKLTQSFDQPVVLDNRGGAATIVGTDIAAKAPADGYTLLLISTTHAVNPSLYARLPYDPLRDFDPVTLIASTPFHAGRTSGACGHDCSRARGARAFQTRPTQLRIIRQRKLHSSDLGALEDCRQDRHDARTVQG